MDRYFIPPFLTHVKHSFSLKERFYSENNKKWLDKYFTFSSTVLEKKTPKSYDEGSVRTKKRIITKVLEDIPADQLLNACQKKLRLSDESESTLNFSDSSESFENEDANAL